jgi:hypothetical protein
LVEPFFDGNRGTDPLYEALRAPDDSTSRAARANLDALWGIAAPFVGADLTKSARGQFHQVFWEVYLAATLQQLGKHLVPRGERGVHAAGPDLVQRAPDVYYEAIAVTPGTTADAVVEASPGVVRTVPDVEISLRLTSGLRGKLAGYIRYRTGGVVAAHVPYVIAINAGSIPSARLEQSLPRIVRSVFPFGYEVVHLDSTTGAWVGRGTYEYRADLPRQSGPPVPTAFFDDDSSCGISAILYSCVNAFNWTDSPGADFVLVFNPRAINPLLHGHLAGTREFWVEGDRLRGEVVPR